MELTEKIKAVYEAIEKELNERRLSAWGKGVHEYALMVVEKNEEDENLVNGNAHKSATCGADSIKDASWGGSYLIYDKDIAKTLCNNSELKRTKYGMRKPNGAEEWLDTQARAVYQAANLIDEVAERLFHYSNEADNFEIAL